MCLFVKFNLLTKAKRFGATIMQSVVVYNIFVVPTTTPLQLKLFADRNGWDEQFKYLTIYLRAMALLFEKSHTRGNLYLQEHMHGPPFMGEI